MADFACVPPCLACRTNGCTKEIVPVKPKRARPDARLRNAQKYAIERGKTPNWRLPCGTDDYPHYTDYDEQLSYACWKPKGKDWYCSVCHKWVKKPPKKKSPVSESDDEIIPF